jgi:hypothetical protein
MVSIDILLKLKVERVLNGIAFRFAVQPILGLMRKPSES